MAIRHVEGRLGLALTALFAAGCGGPFFIQMRTATRLQPKVAGPPAELVMVTPNPPAFHSFYGTGVSYGGVGSSRRRSAPTAAATSAPATAAISVPTSSPPVDRPGRTQESSPPMTQTCGRDEVWDGRVCRGAVQCPPGLRFDPPSGACIELATRSEPTEYQVDLPAWVRTSYGPDGGEGVLGFCGAFSKRPLAFGVRAGASMRVRIDVQVEVPGGEVARAAAKTSSTVDTTGRPAPVKGATEVQQAAQATLASLAAGGTKSSVTVAGTTVTCQIVNSAAPGAVSVSGGV